MIIFQILFQRWLNYKLLQTLIITGQRWSSRELLRGQILKFLALASKPEVFENRHVLGSRTAVFFELLKFCGEPEKLFGRRFFLKIARKSFLKTFFVFFCFAFGDGLKKIFEDLFFFREHLGLCPWPGPR